MEIQKIVSVATVMLFALIGLSNTTVADSVTCGGNAINHDTYCDELAGMPDAFDDGSHGTIGNPLLALQPLGVSDMNDGFAITIEPIGATEGRNNENTVTMPRGNLEFLVHVTQYNPATGLQEDYDISGLGWSFKLLGCRDDACYKDADGEGNFHEWTGAQAVVTGTATGEGATRGYYRVQVSDTAITGDMDGFFAWTFINIPDADWPNSENFQDGYDAASAYYSIMANGLADRDPGVDLFQQARTPIFFEDGEFTAPGGVDGDPMVSSFDFGPGGIPQTVNGEFTFNVKTWTNVGGVWQKYQGPLSVQLWPADTEGSWGNGGGPANFYIPNSDGNDAITANANALPNSMAGYMAIAFETAKAQGDPSSHHMQAKTLFLDDCHVDNAECQARLHAAAILDQKDPVFSGALLTPVYPVATDDYTFSGAVSPPVGLVEQSRDIRIDNPEEHKFDFDIYVTLAGSVVDSSQFTERTNIYVRFAASTAAISTGVDKSNSCHIFGKNDIEARLAGSTIHIDDSICSGEFYVKENEQDSLAQNGAAYVFIDESGDGDKLYGGGQDGYVHYRGYGHEGQARAVQSMADDVYFTIEPRDAVETPIGAAMEYNRRFNYVFDVCAYNDDGRAWDFTDFRMELTTLDHVDLTVYYGDPSQPETYFDTGPEVLVEEETVAYSIGSYGNRDRDVPENDGDNCVVVSVPAFAKNQGLTGGTFQLGFWVSYEDTGKHGFYSEAVNNLHDANQYQAASLVDEGRASGVLLLSRNTIPGGL